MSRQPNYKTKAPSMPVPIIEKKKKKEDNKKDGGKRKTKKQRTTKDPDPIISLVDSPKTPEIPSLNELPIPNGIDMSVVHPGDFTPIREDGADNILLSPPIDPDPDEDIPNSENTEESLPKKRGRGRPPKSKNKTTVDVVFEKRKQMGRPPMIDIKKVMQPEDYETFLRILQKHPEVSSAVWFKLKLPFSFCPDRTTKETSTSSGLSKKRAKTSSSSSQDPSQKKTIYQLTSEAYAALYKTKTSATNTSYFPQFISALVIHRSRFIRTAYSDSLFQLLPEVAESFKITVPDWFNNVYVRQDISPFVPQRALHTEGYDDQENPVYRLVYKGNLVIQLPHPATQQQCDQFGVFPAIPYFKSIDPSCADPEKILKTFSVDSEEVTPLQQFYNSFTTEMQRFSLLPPNYTYGAMTLFHISPEAKAMFQHMNLNSPCLLMLLKHNLKQKNPKERKEREIIGCKKTPIDLTVTEQDRKKKTTKLSEANKFVFHPRIPYIFVPANDGSTISGLLATNENVAVSYILIAITIVKMHD